MFEVRELEGKGMGIIAVKSIKAGDVVHREYPILEFPPNFVEQYRGFIEEGLEMLLAALSFFRKQMTPKQRERLLSLYGGQTISGPRFDYFRDMARDLECDGRAATEAEKDMFARLSLVVSFNAFGHSREDIKLYETACRFCHSCESNCVYDIIGSKIIVKAIVPVQAGEELTVDYYALRRLFPTHIRRWKWMDVKDFTCHCPRCDAPGDDARQFHCHDPACSGRRYACQPLSKSRLRFPTTAYTGVEYVDPHLLPCTVCQRSPPLEYQEALFDSEREWFHWLAEMPDIPPILTMQPVTYHDQQGQLIHAFEPTGVPEAGGLPACLEVFESLEYHVSHAAGFQLAVHELRCRLKLAKLGEAVHTQRIKELATEMDAMLDCFFVAPREQHSTILFEVFAAYLHLGDVANAARIFRRVIRGERVVWGRDSPSRAEALLITEAASELISDWPACKPEEGCVYCEESPERATMTLSRCGACKKVAYCGKACQKAHWKVHKAQCKK
jgi:hypothetical protein